VQNTANALEGSPGRLIIRNGLNNRRSSNNIAFFIIRNSNKNLAIRIMLFSSGGPVHLTHGRNYHLVGFSSFGQKKALTFQQGQTSCFK